MGCDLLKFNKSRVEASVFKDLSRLCVKNGTVFKVFFIYIFCVLAGNEKGKVSVKGNGNGVFGKQLAPGRGSLTAYFTEDIINLSSGQIPVFKKAVVLKDPYTDGLFSFEKLNGVAS